jgi:hypothetical protein
MNQQERDALESFFKYLDILNSAVGDLDKRLLALEQASAHSEHATAIHSSYSISLPTQLSALRQAIARIPR